MHVLKNSDFITILKAFDIKKVSGADEETNKIKKKGLWFFRLPKDLERFDKSWKAEKEEMQKLNKKLGGLKGKKKSVQKGNNELGMPFDIFGYRYEEANE